MTAIIATAAVVVFMSEALREEQGDDQEDQQSAGQHEADQVLRAHSRSTPRSTRASTQNSAMVSTTKATSLIGIHPQDVGGSWGTGRRAPAAPAACRSRRAQSGAGWRRADREAVVVAGTGDSAATWDSADASDSAATGDSAAGPGWARSTPRRAAQASTIAAPITAAARRSTPGCQPSWPYESSAKPLSDSGEVPAAIRPRETVLSKPTTPTTSASTATSADSCEPELVWPGMPQTATGANRAGIARNPAGRRWVTRTRPLCTVRSFACSGPSQATLLRRRGERQRFSRDANGVPGVSHGPLTAAGAVLEQR